MNMEDEYSFMQETVKEERMSPKKVLAKVCKWIGLGLVFGVAACIAFYALKPWAEETFREEPDEVELSDDPEISEPEAPIVETPVEDEDEADKQETKEPLTLDDYFVLNNELKMAANAAQKSVVEVSGIEEGADWTSGEGGILGSTAGLIVADNGRELLILSNYSSTKSTKIYQVKFADGAVHPASLKQMDTNLDIAVYSVAKDEIAESTWDHVEIAEIGNSNHIGQGRTVIAVGRPFGFANGVGYGVVSTVSEKVVKADGEYDIIVTDIAYVPSGSGFLFDIYGNVVGYVEPSLGDGTLVAYGISDITAEIEMMSNGKNIPYVGVVGIMVTEEIAELYGIPIGLYVTGVEVGSPAMEAGIQNGDVITEIKDQEITSIDVYHKALYELQPGHSVKFEGQRYGTEEYVDMDFTVAIGIKE